MPKQNTKPAEFGISLADAARRTGLTERTLWSYVQTGRLPAYRIGAKRVRVLEHDVAALLTPLAGKASAADA